MINVTRYQFPLFECHISRVIWLLKYFMFHLELKSLEMAEPPLISVSLNHRVKLLPLNLMFHSRHLPAQS